jgi:hypothetical protein
MEIGRKKNLTRSHKSTVVSNQQEDAYREQNRKEAREQ